VLPYELSHEEERIVAPLRDAPLLERIDRELRGLGGTVVPALDEQDSKEWYALQYAAYMQEYRDLYTRNELEKCLVEGEEAYRAQLRSLGTPPPYHTDEPTSLVHTQHLCLTVPPASITVDPFGDEIPVPRRVLDEWVWPKPLLDPDITLLKRVAAEIQKEEDRRFLSIMEEMTTSRSKVIFSHPTNVLCFDKEGRPYTLLKAITWASKTIARASMELGVRSKQPPFLLREEDYKDLLAWKP
jgi:hypothetical protein